MANVLLSAYACAPNEGSEPGIGWNWAREILQLGHNVWVLVSPAHQRKIEAVLGSNSWADKINWYFPQSDYWRLEPGQLPKKIRLYNIFWQSAAVKLATKLNAAHSFDLIHHITWGGIRDPSFLGKLGLPFIYGPLGGGEAAPFLLRSDYTPTFYLREVIRDVLNLSIPLNPLLKSGFSRASHILVKTPDSQHVLPRRYQCKARVYSELGIDESTILSAKSISRQGPRLLFVGRLLQLKGAHLAISIFREFKKSVPTARLTIVGKGPDQRRLEAKISQLGLSNYVSIVPWVDRSRLQAIYDSNDVLLFPSLHDSSGNVVLESLARGVPVVCLDCGGPKEIVTPACGGVIETYRRTPREIAIIGAQQLKRVTASPEVYEQLSSAAILRAAEFIWPNRVRTLYESLGYC